MSTTNNPVKHLSRLVCDRFHVIRARGCGKCFLLELESLCEAKRKPEDSSLRADVVL